MENKFKEQIEFLKNSPVFRMSLGSKELFHSNFWKWIIDQDFGKEFIIVFFKDFPIEDFGSATREDKHRDLVIKDKNGNEYVIENKIKSYPNKDQLKEYSKNIVEGAITGIKEPSFEVEKWHFVSYKEISEKISEISKKVVDPYKKSLLDDYCNVVNAIDDTMNYALECNDNDLVFDDGRYCGDLYSIKMLDVYKKLKGDNFVNHMKTLINEINKELIGLEPWKASTSRSFHNGKATLSFEITKEDRDNKKYYGRIGIQIEEYQFRLFLTSPYGNVESLFELGCNLGWFEAGYNKKDNPVIKGHSTIMSKEKCSYSNNWVYQYFSITNDMRSYDSLKELIKNYLFEAVEIIKQNDKLFIDYLQYE